MDCSVDHSVIPYASVGADSHRTRNHILTCPSPIYDDTECSDETLWSCASYTAVVSATCSNI